MTHPGLPHDVPLSGLNRLNRPDRLNRWMDAVSTATVGGSLACA